MDQRLLKVKARPRAMQSYVFLIYEFVLELRPSFVLSIGTQRMQADKAILLAMKDNNYGELVTVDIKDRRHVLEDEEYSDLKEYCHFITGDSTSQKTIDKVKSYCDQYDMAMIDGGHKLPVCQLDVENYFPLIKSGSIILMHDTVNKNEEVFKTWETIKDEKFNLNWGKAAGGIIPGLGIVRKA